MEVQNVFVNITSPDPDRLLKFYNEVVGLPKAENMGEFAVQANGTTFGFDRHSEVAGATKEPARVLYNFFVPDLAAEQKRIEGHGVKFIRTAGREYWGGVISTFPDPDGNLLQLIEYKPE